MAIVLLVISLIGLLLIATESVNHINKAAVAMFAGVSCWLLYIAYGVDFVASEHPMEFLAYVSSHAITVHSIKDFISDTLFLKYVAQGANVVLFLLATTTIVEVLSNNGCFDFVAEWLRTRRPKKLMWMLALFTFILSANLDNLLTVVLLLTIVHPLLQTDTLRRMYGTVVILAANCGGVITVIGDMTSLKLWTDGLIAPSEYFLTLVVPVVAALSTILLLLQHNLPSRIEFTTTTLPYRGDDTLLSRPQRLLMLFVGVGGLWFIPTFYRITQMPPFVGALCVLALLWIVDEICNRQLLSSDTMVRRRQPQALQYANLQNLLYFLGLILMFGALAESGLLRQFLHWLLSWCADIYAISFVSAFISAVLGNVPTLLAGVSVFNQPEQLAFPDSMLAEGQFWPLLSYATAFGGSMLSTGTIAGILLMRMEGVSFSWYFRHVTPKVIAGFLVGFLVLVLIQWSL